MIVIRKMSLEFGMTVFYIYLQFSQYRNGRNLNRVGISGSLNRVDDKQK